MNKILVPVSVHSTTSRLPLDDFLILNTVLTDARDYFGDDFESQFRIKATLHLLLAVKPSTLI